MTASVQAWQDLVNHLPMEDIEEGLLDDASNSPLKFCGKSTAFSEKTEHDWKELVSDPSLSVGEVTTSDSNKTEVQDNDVNGGINQKDWDQYLSTFSLNDGDSTQFMALEVHTDGGQDIKDFGASQMEVGQNITLPEVPSLASEENIAAAQDSQSQIVMQQQNSPTNNHSLLEDATFPTTSKSETEQKLFPQKFTWTSKKDCPDGGNSYETSSTVGRPDSALKITGGTSDTALGFQNLSKSTRRPDSVPLRSSTMDNEVDKTDFKISNIKAQWQTESTIQRYVATGRQAIGLGEEKNTPVISKGVSHVPGAINVLHTYRNLTSTNTDVLSSSDRRNSDMKTPETRSRSALDMHNYFPPKQSSSLPRANSAPLWQGTNMNKQAVPMSSSDFQTIETSKFIHQTRYAYPKEAARMDSWENSKEQRKISGADEDILQNSHPFSKPSSTVTSKEATEGVGENILPELPCRKPTNVKEGNSDPSDKFKETNIAKAELELKPLLEGANRHFVTVDVPEIGSNKEQTNSAFLTDSKLDSNSFSTDIQPTSFVNTLDHAKSLPDAISVTSSRESTENLPVRPLTIGNSLTKGSSLTYRPVSPFQPDLYPTTTALSIPVVTSNVSASQYSEGTLLDADEEGGGDMSARERLQPLGRDGLEVKQGPPWGIMMPLFQPDSRNSSLSSNDSSASNNQYFQLQASSSEQSKLVTDPQNSVSSTKLETELSRKASVKSLEPKEPMGVKMMSVAGPIKTPVGKFHQQHPANIDGDSPVSKILGPTFKATQKMLEELQRRPLGAYDEDLEPVKKIAAEDTAHRYESEMSEEKETVISDQRLANGSYYVEMETDERKESGQMTGNITAEDRRDSVDSRLSCDSRASRDKIEKPARDNTRPMPQIGGPQRDQDSRSLAVEEIENPTRDFLHEVSISHSALDFTPVTTANIGLDNYTRTPVISQNDGNVHGGFLQAVGSHSRRNESYKTSELTDSTLGNSVGLSGHMIPTEGEKRNEGAATRKADPECLSWDNLIENGKDASDLSEFDRVASESISWSNAVANQFREEIKAVDLEIKAGLPEREGEKPLVHVSEPGTTTPISDSGLSDSTTNDEIYRPKGLTRLSAGNGPIGIYDVRRSSGPGSTNRKRFALGRRPRESSFSLQMEGIYVSDGTTGSTITDRGNQVQSRQSYHSQDSNVDKSVYVSEETTSGTEVVDNDIDSEPEGQSTPKSEDISARLSSGVATSVREVSGKEVGKPLVDMYVGLSNFAFEKPSRRTPPAFTTYEISKPSRQPRSAFMHFKSEESSRDNPPAFSTFEVDKSMKANAPEASKRVVEVTGSSLGTEVCNVTRLQPTAKVEHTWSISKPVMSQLSVKTAPMVIHDVERESKITTKQKPLIKPKQIISTSLPDQRPKHTPQGKETVPKAIQQHVKDQSSESRRNPDKDAATQRKKSVADIILENMLHEEQEQKNRRKKLKMKQEQTSQDLNQLWERFQEVVGKKSRTFRKSRMSRVVRARPSRESSSTDISVTSSSDRKDGGHSIDIGTDSDEEFERFLSRVREIQSSESASYLEDQGSMTSRPSSSRHRVKQDQAESETTPSERLHRQPHPKAVDSSTSMSSIATSDDPLLTRNASQTSGRSSRKTVRQSVDRPVPVFVSSSVTEMESEVPVSLPMWLSVKHKEMLKKVKSSSSCTCGAKSRKEKAKTSQVRDVGVNCPTPPIVPQELLPIASDIDVLRAGPLKQGMSNQAPASLVKLSLQDAFMYSKQDFIEKSRERVNKVRERREERKNEKTDSAQVVVVVPSEKTKPWKENRKPVEKRMMDCKPNKQFEQLQKKKPRPMSTKEIRDVNKRMYKNLPEVRKKRDEERRAEFYKTNRLRAQLYGKHVRNTNRIFTAS